MIRINASQRHARCVFEDIVQPDQLRIGGNEKFRALGESGRDVERIGGANASVLKL
ncbi:MAG TPA: hypothetical protein VHX14_03825 [Thermoanaerobaculia bacterium]|nr:hypothetical protein [Thermoanaerobaculia bacterium]